MIFSRAGWRRGASRAHPAPGVRALDLSGLVLDTTNFATFIDTGNLKAPIAQRGKAKQMRHSRALRAAAG